MADKILHYEILEQQVGEEVIASRAWDPKTGRHVTIKEPRPHLLHEPSFVENFLEEGRRLAKIQNPHVVTLYQIIFPEETGGNCYVVLEHVPQSVDDLLQQGPVEVAKGRLILRDALEGLWTIHLADLYHTNICPSSVLLTPDGRTKMTNFGTTWTRTRRGTMKLAAGRYSPHETWGRNGRVGPWSDLYALGCVIYELFVGSSGFNELLDSLGDSKTKEPEAIGSRFRAWHGDIGLKAPSLKKREPQIDQQLSDVVSRLMAKPIEERFKDAQEALDALGECATEGIRIPTEKQSQVRQKTRFVTIQTSQTKTPAQSQKLTNGKSADNGNGNPRMLIKQAVQQLFERRSPKWKDCLIILSVGILGFFLMILTIVLAGGGQDLWGWASELFK